MIRLSFSPPLNHFATLATTTRKTPNANDQSKKSELNRLICVNAKRGQNLPEICFANRFLADFQRICGLFQKSAKNLLSSVKNLFGSAMNALAILGLTLLALLVVALIGWLISRWIRPRAFGAPRPAQVLPPSVTMPAPAQDPSSVTMPAPTPTPALSQTDWLESLNAYRQRACAGPLTWNAELASNSAAWLQELKNQGCSVRLPTQDVDVPTALAELGKFMFDGSAWTNMSISDQPSSQEAVSNWFNEYTCYDFTEAPNEQECAKNFIAMAWKAANKVGCASIDCNGKTLSACSYQPVDPNEDNPFANIANPANCQ
jgi:hypothetical protein